MFGGGFTNYKIVEYFESNLTVEQLALLRSLVAEYSDIFALDMTELGITDLVYHTINTCDSSN